MANHTEVIFKELARNIYEKLTTNSSIRSNISEIKKIEQVNLEIFFEIYEFRCQSKT